MIRTAYAIICSCLMCSCGEPPNYVELDHARILACWNNQEGHIMVTVGTPDGAVRQFDLLPESSLACDMWYTRREWHIQLRRTPYEHTWNLEVAK